MGNSSPFRITKFNNSHEHDLHFTFVGGGITSNKSRILKHPGEEESVSCSGQSLPEHIECETCKIGEDCWFAPGTDYNVTIKDGHFRLAKK